MAALATVTMRSQEGVVPETGVREPAIRSSASAYFHIQKWLVSPAKDRWMGNHLKKLLVVFANCLCDSAMQVAVRSYWLGSTLTMTTYPAVPAGQVCSPPELPPYLKIVHDLKPIVGAPSDDEVVQIHNVIRVANKVADVQGVGDPELLAQLFEYLFEVQMAKYQSKYPCSIFITDITYTPPVLPTHLSVNLKPVSGIPSTEHVINIHEAIRSYQKYSDIPALFDPKVNAELSQHLFDIQMARFMSRAHRRQSHPLSQKATLPTTSNTADLSHNAEIGSSTVELESTRDLQDVHSGFHTSTPREVLEQPNQPVGRLDGDMPPRELDRWWDPQIHQRKPGPGMLAPRVIEMIHDVDHTLYEVTISGNPTASPVTNAWNSASGPPISHTPPTSEELLDATPHPAALYCREHHGWVVSFISATSATASHLAVHWCSDPGKKALLDKLPDASLRANEDCLDSEVSSSNSGQKMHHFHRYPNTVAGSGLLPALKRPNATPDSRRDVEVPSEARPQDKAGEVQLSWEQAPVAEHLDLYLCCQCKTRILSSPGAGIIPCIIPPGSLNSFIQDRYSSPKPGQRKEQSALSTLEMLLRLVEEPLWFGNSKYLRTSGKVFNAKIGWTEHTQRIFEAMGFTTEEDHLFPPLLDTATPQGRAARLKLLRVWVEIGAVIADYTLRYPKLVQTRRNFIRLKNSRQGLAARLGSDTKRMPRNEDTSALTTVPTRVWDNLGITVSAATPVVIETAYHAQLRCDPLNTPTYYDAIQTLSRQPRLPNVAAIQSLVTTEASKGRWSHIELLEAAQKLGFGASSTIGAEYIPQERDDDSLFSAFQAAKRLAGADVTQRSEIEESLRILAESRASEKLMKHYEEVKMSK